MILYYVFKFGAEYAVVEMTAGQMHRRVKTEPELGAALDTMPFKTREDAEKRRDQLNKELSETPKEGE